MAAAPTSREVIAVLEDEDGSLTVEYLGDGVALTRFSGHFTVTFARHVMEQVGALRSRHGVLHVFHDWWGLVRHDGKARALLSRWTLETRKDRASAHILVNVGSPVMAMAVTVTNLVLQEAVHIHESRPTFERALTRCLGAAGAP